MNTLPAIKNSQGEMVPLQEGKWYIASYGFDSVEGYCTTVTAHGAMLMFRWGTPFRQKHFVDSFRILGECKDPRLFSSFRKLFD